MKTSGIWRMTCAAFLPLSLAGCGGADQTGANAEGNGPEKTGNAFTDGFNAQWYESFVDSCVTQATQMSVPQGEANEKCTCAADYLDKNLDNVVDKANPPMEKMQAAVKECLN